MKVIVRIPTLVATSERKIITIEIPSGKISENFTTRDNAGLSFHEKKTALTEK